MRTFLLLFLSISLSINALAQERPFITVWNIHTTDFTFPGNGDNYDIKWESLDSRKKGSVVGSHYVKISLPKKGRYKFIVSKGSGKFHGLGTMQNTYPELWRTLEAVSQWGTNEWSFLDFDGYENMDITATDVPNLSKVKNLSAVFRGCKNLKGNASFSKWDVSNVTEMRETFKNAANFNQDISKWDVSKVTNMESMFSGARMFNQDISKWNVSKVTDMTGMFASAANFNQNINNWDVSNTEAMQAMFAYATNFNQPLDKWNVSKVTNMSLMFVDMAKFNQPIGNWDVSNVTKMDYMFDKCTSFNQPLYKWNMSNVINIAGMFRDASSFSQNISSWNVSNVKECVNFFLNTLLTEDKIPAILLVKNANEVVALNARVKAWNEKNAKEDAARNGTTTTNTDTKISNYGSALWDLHNQFKSETHSLFNNSTETYYTPHAWGQSYASCLQTLYKMKSVAQESNLVRSKKTELVDYLGRLIKVMEENGTKTNLSRMTLNNLAYQLQQDSQQIGDILKQ